MGWQPEIDELCRREEMAHRMGDEDKIKRGHDGGRLTVRECIERLLDPGSFHEIGAIASKAEYDETGNLTDFTASNFVMGRGRIDGRTVSVGGEQMLSEQMAGELGMPMVRLVDGTGGGSVKTCETTGSTYVPRNPGRESSSTTSPRCRSWRWAWAPRPAPARRDS